MDLFEDIGLTDSKEEFEGFNVEDVRRVRARYDS